MVKRIIKHLFLENNKDVKEQYLDYLRDNGSGGIIGNLEKGLKLLELNKNYYLKGIRYPSSKQSPTFITVAELIKTLMDYDIISFDVFDTLLFRRVSAPVDVFLYMEAKYHFYNFSHLRVQAEQEARKKTRSSEVTLRDIYQVLALKCNLDIDLWIEREIATEKELCFANPYMMEVFKQLQSCKKTMIATSDMYLPSSVISDLLKTVGYTWLENIFVSCEVGHGKWNGEIFPFIEEKFPGKTVAHIGDNKVADVIRPSEAGWYTVHYPNSASFASRRELSEMSALTHSRYEAIVNTTLYNGLHKFSPYFCIGFEYGGMLTVGYCQWLQETAAREGIDKLLFVARDGYIFKKIYDKYFKGIPTEYVPFSRFNAQQVMFDCYTDSYIEQTLFPRAHRREKITIRQALEELDLNFLISELSKYSLDSEAQLVPALMKRITDFIYSNKRQIEKYFSQTQEATYEYFLPIVSNCKKIMVVDLGWNGTCGIALKYLLEEKKGMDLTVFNALIGTRDGQEPTVRMANKDLFVYGFAANYNRDLQNIHMGSDVDYHNLLMEVLFTAPEPSFLKFYYDNQGAVKTLYDTEPSDDFKTQTLAIHKGIETFAKIWLNFPQEMDSLFCVRGRDALLPIQKFWKRSQEGQQFVQSFSVKSLSGIPKNVK